tara:strand:- start:348 stop:974 length:627 start_codon:yes stop_codon:yes gene_type:complete
MPAFPRTVIPGKVTLPKVPTGLVSRARTGGVQLRSEVSAGRTWRETWPQALLASNADVQALFTFVEDARNMLTTFDITHYLLPGSGMPANGTGGGTPLVVGATEAGTSIATDGWPASTSDNMRAGDVFTIAGLNQLFRATADVDSNGSGAATIGINPPILVGASPANNAALTIGGATIRAYIADYSPMPEAGPDQFVGGYWVQFQEAP